MNTRIRVICLYTFETGIPVHLHDDKCPAMSDIVTEHLESVDNFERDAFAFYDAEELDPE